MAKLTERRQKKKQKSQPQEQRILSTNVTTPIREPNFIPSQVDYLYDTPLNMICQVINKNKCLEKRMRLSYNYNNKR